MPSPEAAAALDWLRAIAQPERAAAWTLAEWDRAVRLARRHRLLARLAWTLDEVGLAAAVPAPVQPHLLSARRISEFRIRAVRWALENLGDTLAGLGAPLVLLKGAAYLGQDLRVARGREPSDLDILVPRQALDEAQRRLAHAGWREPPMDERDRRYYLDWSHELPPMSHGRYLVELDVHHNILPPRAGGMLDAGLLFSQLRPSRWQPWQVLSPVDQLLHSAAHLFFDSEPRDRVRDLVDLDELFRHFGAAPTFWDDLPQRAVALGLVEPLALACRFTRAWLGTPIPEAVRATLAVTGPGRARMRCLVTLMGSVLLPTEPDRVDPFRKRAAAGAVLTRYHWHRMPLGVLVPHLWRKWRDDSTVARPITVAAREPGRG